MQRAEFQKDLARGKAAETELDNYFSRFYDVLPVDVETERANGIDRLFIRSDGARFSIEIKRDYKACETGFIYLEVISNNLSGAAGWILKSTAQILIYQTNTTIFISDMALLKRMLPAWRGIYRTAFTPNYDKQGRLLYKSVGLLVPVDVFESVCFCVIKGGENE